MTGAAPCRLFAYSSAELAAGVLDGPQRAALLAHAATCPDCQSELRGLTATVDAIAVLAPPIEPPEAFKEAVLARWTAEGAGEDRVAAPARRRDLGSTGPGSASPGSAAPGSSWPGGSWPGGSWPSGLMPGGASGSSPKPDQSGGAGRPGHRPRRPAGVARRAVAAVAFVAGVAGLSFAAGRAGDEGSERADYAAPPQSSPAAGVAATAALTDRASNVLGWVALRRGAHDELVMVLGPTALAGTYRCLLRDAAGVEHEVGSWWAEAGEGGAWTFSLPVPSRGDVTPTVVVRDGDGTVVATARPR